MAGTNTASSLERKLATILSADVAGYSRLMAEDEEQTLQTFRGHREVFEKLVVLHRGRVFNTTGDAIQAHVEAGGLGKRVERSERGVPGEYADLENMTADELRAALVEGLEAAGLRIEDIAQGESAGSAGSKPH